MQLRGRLEHIGKNIAQRGGLHIILLLLGTALALLIRISLLDFKSVDYLFDTKFWYNALQFRGLAALRNNLSDYNPPFLYLLYVVMRLLPNLDKVAALKIPSVVTDFVCAGFVYAIVHLKYRRSSVALLGYMAALLAPVVILNGAFWGQFDSIYTAGLLACTYFLLVKRNWLALLGFGVAFAFKLQAVFLLPFLIALWAKKVIAWQHFLAIPLVYLVSILPAWLIGRPFTSLFTIYLSQVGEYESLSMHAPNLYAWFPNQPEIYRLWYPAGLLFGSVVILILILIVMRSKVEFNSSRIVELATVTVLIVPFVLPKMHQRYFFPADVLSIVFGFYFPSYFYIPLVINAVSYFSYEQFLFGQETFSMPILGLVMLFAVIVLVRKWIRDLYPANKASQGKNSYPLPESE